MTGATQRARKGADSDATVAAAALSQDAPPPASTERIASLEPRIEALLARNKALLPQIKQRVLDGSSADVVAAMAAFCDNVIAVLGE